jgi:hypothetical protein
MAVACFDSYGAHVHIGNARASAKAETRGKPCV